MIQEYPTEFMEMDVEELCPIDRIENADIPEALFEVVEEDDQCYADLSVWDSYSGANEIQRI